MGKYDLKPKTGFRICIRKLEYTIFAPQKRGFFMININGKFLAESDAKLEVENRGFTFGDAVFETLRVIRGKVIFWEDHYFRLMSSMRIMRMEIPDNFSPEFLENEINKLIEINKLQDSAARIRINIYRKQGGLYIPNFSEIEYNMTVQKLSAEFYLWNDIDYEVELFKDFQVNSGLLSTIKTNNRAVNVLAGIFAKENGYQNCLLLNENKNVVEAINGNIFLLKQNVLKTPPLKDGCLTGITRKKIIEIAKSTDLELVQESISPFELQKADEMFLTNVVVGIQPIKKYRKKLYTTSIAKELLAKLNLKARTF